MSQRMEAEADRDRNERSAEDAAASPDTPPNARKAWTIAFATLVALIPSAAAIQLYSQGFFVGPMTEEFGWSRTEFMSAVSISLILLSLIYPLVGYWGDRYGARQILLGGAVVYGVATMSLSLLGGNLLLYTIVTMFVGLVSIIQSPLLYVKALTAWAPQHIRGKTMAIAVSGSPIGNFIIPLITVWLITHYGWRGGRIGLGLTIIVIAIPMIFLFIREPAKTRRDAASAPATQGSLWQGLVDLARDRNCRLLVALLGLGGLALNGLLAHLIPMLTDRGFTLTQATAGLTTMAIAGACGRLASGWVLDRIQTPRAGLGWFILGVVGTALVMVADSMTVAMAGIACIGLSVGAEVELAAYFAARYFPVERFGETFGVLSASYSIGTALGSLIFGISFDVTGSYVAALLLGMACLIGSCLGILALPPYPAGREH